MPQSVPVARIRLVKMEVTGQPALWEPASRNLVGPPEPPMETRRALERDPYGSPPRLTL
ncbi:MAG: hypothetical protein H6Q88_537 [Anaeromyxobacteraceae bacterium]|nr:hypothetical protein [Anaeromyxobacteraceae bacterium]